MYLYLGLDLQIEVLWSPDIWLLLFTLVSHACCWVITRWPSCSLADSLKYHNTLTPWCPGLLRSQLQTPGIYQELAALPTQLRSTARHDPNTM